MKYKKQSLKKKHRRHRFSKKYTSAVTFQRGGGFMDVIAQLNTMEGRTNTCMAVHLTQPLVAVGDDAGTVTLWEINPSQPKKLALLTGLQIAVKCVEFHPSLPVVAAACSDKVLMWRFDQINREQEQQQEGGAVQQLEPLKLELDSIRTNARNEVSCIAFHPISVTQNTSYISVGVNNDAVPKNNEIHIYYFGIEPSSPLYLNHLPLYLKTEIPDDGKYPENEKVLLTSFSHDGALFAFVTKSLIDGTPVLKVINFGQGGRYEPTECGTCYIRKKCDITCIRPYRTESSYHNGSFYKFPGPMRTHNFIIGCDDGSLMEIKAVTIYMRKLNLTRVEDVRPNRVWNAGEAIECVAVHPSLPLFASGSRNAVQLWDVDVGEKKPLVVQPEVTLTPVISVGFNDNFLTACGRGVRVYSCNANDYRGFKEELKKELKSGTEIAKYGTELVLAGRQGERCSICNEPMNDPLTQPLLRSGVPSDAEEVYLGCGHKFHKGCITTWIKQGKPCPLCRADSGLAQATPQRIIKGRKELQDLQHQQGTRVVAENLVDRFGRYEPRGLDFGQGAAAASSAPEAVAVVEPPASAELTPEQLRAARLADIERRRKEQPPPESNGGGIKNKYSRKKYSSKKLKFRRRHSNKK